MCHRVYNIVMKSMYGNNDLLSLRVNEEFLAVSQGINEESGLNPNYDQSMGNQCAPLTRHVKDMLAGDGYNVSRELHEKGSKWHYLLAHDLSATDNRTEFDVISDLNPWQWRDFGGGLLHGERGWVMEQLAKAGAPERFVALRGVATITIRDDTRRNPFDTRVY